MMNKLHDFLKNITAKIEDIFKTGNQKKIIIKDENGESYIELPLLIAIILTIAAPIVALVGFFAGVAARFSIEMSNRQKSRIILVDEDKV